MSRVAVSIVIVLTCVARSFSQDKADPPPVLTVCEALQDLKAYRDKDVVIVARSVYTFEGTFLNEDCAEDGKIVIQGHRWPSRIYRGGDGRPPANKSGFKFDEDLLRRKLLQVKRTTSLKSDEKLRQAWNPFADHWTAVVGRLVSPPVLISHRPASASQSKSRPGNGFGPNGAVPAAVIYWGAFDFSTQP